MTPTLGYGQHVWLLRWTMQGGFKHWVSYRQAIDHRPEQYLLVGLAEATIFTDLADAAAVALPGEGQVRVVPFIVTHDRELVELRP